MHCLRPRVPSISFVLLSPKATSHDHQLQHPPTSTPTMENFHLHQTQHSGANYTTASKIPHACNTNRTVEDLQKYAALT